MVTSISCLVYHTNPCKFKTSQSVFSLKNVFQNIGEQDLSNVHMSMYFVFLSTGTSTDGLME